MNQHTSALRRHGGNILKLSLVAAMAVSGGYLVARVVHADEAGTVHSGEQCAKKDRRGGKDDAPCAKPCEKCAKDKPCARKDGKQTHAGKYDAAEHHARMQAHVEKTLRDVGASDEQVATVSAALDSMHAQMQELHDAKRTLRPNVMAVLSGETVDRSALERERTAAVAAADAASKAIFAALADAADALTPEQRQALADKMAAHRAEYEGHHRNQRGAGPGGDAHDAGDDE